MPKKQSSAQPTAIVKAETPMPWEQQPDEGNKPFAAFCAYLELGNDRTLAKVGKRLGKSATLVERWSSRFNWSTRLQEFNRHFAAVRRESEEKAIRLANVDWGIRLTMHREALWNDAQALRQKGVEILKISSAKATVNDGVRALSVASELERLALGLPANHGDVAQGGMAISNSTVLVQFPDNFRDKPKPIESTPQPALPTAAGEQELDSEAIEGQLEPVEEAGTPANTGEFESPPST